MHEEERMEKERIGSRDGRKFGKEYEKRINGKCTRIRKRKCEEGSRRSKKRKQKNWWKF